MPDFIKSNYFFSFLVRLIRKNSFYGAVRRAYSHLKKFFLIGRIVRYLRIAVSIIEASAALIFISAAVLALIPLLLLSLIGFAVADRVIGSKIIRSREFNDYLQRHSIIIICGAAAFGEGFAAELARSGTAVFIVTADPSRRFVSAVRKNGVYYIRHAFYFRLKRKFLSKHSDRITYLL